MTELIILSLATWRISNLLIEEDGPYSVFILIRGWVFRNVENGTAKRGSLAYLFTCPLCMSLNVAIVLSLLFGSPILLAFAASALSIIFNWIVKSAERKMYEHDATIGMLQMQTNRLQLQIENEFVFEEPEADVSQGTGI